MEELRRLVEAGDIEGVAHHLAEDCVFRSPALHRPYQGREATMVFLRAAFEVFEDFGYVRTFAEDDGRGHVLMFEAEVDGRRLQGVDVLRLDEAGLVSEFTVLVRPMTGLTALAGQMAPRVQRALGG